MTGSILVKSQDYSLNGRIGGEKKRVRRLGLGGGRRGEKLWLGRGKVFRYGMIRAKAWARLRGRGTVEGGVAGL